MVRQTIGWTISPSWYLNLDLDSLYSLWTIISCNKHFTHSHITIRHHPFPCLKEKDFPSTLVELLSRIDPHCKSRSTSISIHHNHFLYQLSGVLSLICKPNVSPLIPNPRDSIDNPLNPFQPNEYGIAFSTDSSSDVAISGSDSILLLSEKPIRTIGDEQENTSSSPSSCFGDPISLMRATLNRTSQYLLWIDWLSSPLDCNDGDPEDLMGPISHFSFTLLLFLGNTTNLGEFREGGGREVLYSSVIRLYTYR